MADQSDSSHSSRHEIVSSLINLSETICEKALELEGVEGAEELVKRGGALQQKSKKKQAKARPDAAVAKNDVQVSCCEMEQGRKGYVKSSPLYDVELRKSDSYDLVLSKVCGTIGI